MGCGFLSSITGIAGENNSDYTLSSVVHRTTSNHVDWIASKKSKVLLREELFQSDSCIGKGKFGMVYLSKIHASEHSEHVAVKYIPKQMIFDSKLIDKIQNEIDILQLLDFHFITHCFGVFETPTCIGIVLEFCAGGELYNRMKRLQKMPEEHAKFYFTEIACTLHHLHSTKNIIFRDLKPENILIDEHGDIKLCDFGFAVKLGPHSTQLSDVCGTAMYIAPEIAVGRTHCSHSYPVDWWALGCILFEMVSGEAPFGDGEKHTKFEIFNNINNRNVSYPVFMNPTLKDMIKGLLNKHQATRFGWTEVCASPWLSQIVWSDIEERRVVPPWIPSIKNTVDTSHFLKWDKVELPSQRPDDKVSDYCRPLVRARAGTVLRRDNSVRTTEDRNSSRSVGSDQFRGPSRANSTISSQSTNPKVGNINKRSASYRSEDTAAMAKPLCRQLSSRAESFKGCDEAGVKLLSRHMSVRTDKSPTRESVRGIDEDKPPYGLMRIESFREELASESIGKSPQDLTRATSKAGHGHGKH